MDPSSTNTLESVGKGPSCAEGPSPFAKIDPTLRYLLCFNFGQSRCWVAKPLSAKDAQRSSSSTGNRQCNLPSEISRHSWKHAGASFPYALAMRFLLYYTELKARKASNLMSLINKEMKSWHILHRTTVCNKQFGRNHQESFYLTTTKAGTELPDMAPCFKARAETDNGRRSKRVLGVIVGTDQTLLTS